MYTAAAAPLPPVPRCTPGVPMEYPGETSSKVVICCFAVSMGYIPQTTLSATMPTTANPHMVTTPSPRPTYSSLGPLSILHAAVCFCPPHGHRGCNGHHAHARCSLASTDPRSRGPPTVLQVILATAPCMISPPTNRQGYCHPHDFAPTCCTHYSPTHIQAIPAGARTQHCHRSPWLPAPQAP